MAQKSKFTAAIFRIGMRLIGSLIVVVSSASLAQTPLVQFAKVVTYSSGGSFATSVAVADLNRDGQLDVAVANLCQSQPYDCSRSNIGILLGKGDGTFGKAMTYGNGGTSIAAADINRDNILDLVTATGDCCLWVMLGNGDGSFQTPISYPSGGYEANSVAVKDLNGDGNPDLVAVNSLAFGPGEDGLVSVFLGNGDGTFEKPVGFSSGGSFANSVVITDVNGDERPDLVVSNYAQTCSGCTGGGVSLLFGNGDGTFRPPISYGSGGSQAQSVAISDVSGDSKLDLLVANFASASVGVLLGNGDGTFGAAKTFPSGEGLTNSVQVADVNGDARPDLLVANGTSVSILLGNGDGTFRTPVSYPSGGMLEANLSSTLAVADVNADGKPDLVAADYCRINNCEEGAVGVLLNKTHVCSSPPVITTSATPGSLWPSNKRNIPVTISGTIVNNGCVVINPIYVVKDEYGKIQPSGALTLDTGGEYRFTLWLQSYRLGTDLDGRLYTVTVSAGNSDGKRGSQATTVVVPHDERH